MKFKWYDKYSSTHMENVVASVSAGVSVECECERECEHEWVQINLLAEVNAI